MKSNFLKYNILLRLFILLLCTSFMYGKVEKPNPPTNFQVISQVGNFGLFKWKVTQTSGQIQDFKIYYHNDRTEDISSFELFETILREDSSLKKDKEGYHYIYLHTKKGEYSFFITVTNQFGESDHSNIVYVIIGENQVRIEFTSQPNTIGFVGETYVYDVNAIATNSEMLKYELQTGPSGMSIYHSNGEISWIPKERGIYNAVVKASLVSNPEIFNLHSWTINVKSCEKLTSISGTINYEEDDKVESGIVKVYKQIGPPQNEPVFLTSIQFTNGEFSIDVDEGVYLLRFEGENFVAEWYEDAYLLAEAKRIQIKCGDEIKANAKVDKNIPIETYLVSGKVTRESDRAAVPFAPVHFAGRNIQTEETKLKGVIANEQGYYEIKLDGNFNYIASTIECQNYLPQFYDKADNISEATIIELNSNREHIDFILKEKPTFLNEISGIVKDDVGNRITGMNVIAFRVDPKPDINQRYISRNAVTDNNGNFKFENLLSGKYILLVFSSINLRKIPGYYMSNNQIIRTWYDATKIEIGETTVKDEIVIQVPSLTAQESGRGIITGVITEVLNNEKSIAGALVFALDQNSHVRNFTFTDDLGRYEMHGMKSGKYTISADKVGFYHYNTEVELVDDNSTIDNNVKLNRVSVGVTDDEPLKIELYPNPVCDILHIFFNEISNEINISVFNTLGEQLNSNVYYANDSQNGININVSKLNTGIYYLKIENDSYSGVFPFIISR